MEDPPRRSLEVEPARVGRRRTSVVPILVSVAAAAFVLVAVVKPWDGDGPAGASSSAGGSSAGETAPPRTETPHPSPLGTPLAAPPSDDDLLAAATRRSTWGVRAVVLPAGGPPAGDGAGVGLEERWTGVDDPGYRSAATTRTVAASSAIAGDGEAVLAIGVTTPADALPLDIRFWRLDTGGAPQRLVPAAIPGPDPGSWLWRPDPASATVADAWPAGTYRIDVLLGASIDRIVVVVPGESTPTGRGTPGATLPPDLATDVGRLGEGLFVVVAGRPIAVDTLAASDGDELDEREAWLSPGIDRPAWAIGRVASSVVAGIGVVLPRGASPTSLVLDLLSPIEASVAAPVDLLPLPADPSAVPRQNADRMAIVAHADGGRPFAPGTYRVWASWRTAAGEPGSSFRYLEIVPAAPATPPGSPLEALRRWTGLTTVPAGTTAQPLVTDADLRPSRMTGTCGGTEMVTWSTPLLGLVLPRDDQVVDIRLIAPDGYTHIETRAMLPGDDGLALLALPSGGLIPGRYRIDVTRAVPGGSRAPEPDTRGTSYDVCFR